MSKPRILTWDIENSPASGWFWGSTYNTNIVEVIQPSRVMSFAAKWRGEKTVQYFSDHHDGHDVMIEKAWELLDEADALISYNGKQHDTPHISTEILLANDGVPPSPFREIDLYRVTKRRFKFQRNRLDFVSQELGIGEKVKHEGFGLWLKCMAGDEAAWRRFRAYNIEDVNLTERYYERLLPWIPPSMHPHFGLFAGDVDACSKCGGHDLQRRGYARTTLATYQRFQCNACGSWSRGKKAEATVDMRGVE